ncbi:diguanylate cyclase domain-containing protein [Mycoplana dimorpha]|uniref:GGDEF domain-containing protein n=1 Tax=Mycoplana dimorpha TaxID=28320 RepID=A0A2T5B1G3_MYCDI|nr:diguanylate cyclase [Mycoplana dimorpha]PTM92819.1 GGDEF domain-containing protein [Mycoplana dimorpha]
MFRDGLPLTSARRDDHAVVTAPWVTLLSYGILVIAALVTGLQLILAALQAPLGLQPTPASGSLSEELGPQLLMASSVAVLLAALAGLGLQALVQRRTTRLERTAFVEVLANARNPAASIGVHKAPAAPGFLVLFDVAHFTFLSQRHGSELADGVMRLVADELFRTARAPHQVCCADAGEFAVRFASPELDECILFVEQVRRSVASRTITAGGVSVVIGLMAGVARIGPNDPPTAAREAARRALENGRNAASDRTVYAFERHAKPVV